MDRPFSDLVATEGWRAAATGWVEDRLASVGRKVTGVIEQPRIRPWSTQLVVPTDRGTVWFKANCPAMAFEPGLHALLAELEPGEVDAPLAIDADRGWMMTADRGKTLGDSHEATLEELLAAPLPSSLQHGDLHPANVFVVDAGMRLFDFGDAQWAHVLEVLAVPYGLLHPHHAPPVVLAPGRLCRGVDRRGGPRRPRGADDPGHGHARREPLVHLAQRDPGCPS